MYKADRLTIYIHNWLHDATGEHPLKTVPTGGPDEKPYRNLEYDNKLMGVHDKFVWIQNLAPN